MSKDLSYQLPLFLDYSAQIDRSYDEFVEHKADRIFLTRGLTLVYGLQAGGKTQFIKAVLKEAKLRKLTTYFVETNVPYDHSAFEKAGLYNFVCLDNLNEVCGISEWELSLFHLINFMEDTKKKLVLGTSVAPDNLEVNLADLGSRLRSADRVYLGPFDDEARIDFMRRIAKLRGLEISSDVGKFILRRSKRDMQEIEALVEKLEAETMKQHRKLSIPFVKEILRI